MTLTPVECLEEELRKIKVELDFAKDTGMKRMYKESKEAYETAIDILYSEGM